MTRAKQYLPIFLFLFILSCGGKLNNKKHTVSQQILTTEPSSITEDEESSVQPDTISVYFGDGIYKKINPFTSSAAKGFVGDSTRIFIKTADIKFRVKSTIRATYEIEDITHRFGGYVTYTHLESTTHSRTIIAVSEDSLLQTERYTVENSMVLRVPANRMDSCLRAISPLVDYLDYRTIKTRNVYLDLLTKQLAQQRIKKFQSKVQLAADKHGDHLNEITDSQESMLYQQAQSDQAKIDALALQDSVEFCTISLSIYQREAIKRELIGNEKNINAYEPGFSYKFIQSFKTGWNAAKNIILFLTKFWVLIVLAAITVLLIRILRKKIN